MKTMTKYQCEITGEYMYLVKEVIGKRIKVTGEPLLTYEDLYQVGCEALCHAAMDYDPRRGQFEALASRCIYNAIIDHCRKQNAYRSNTTADVFSADQDRGLHDVCGVATDFDDLAHGRDVFRALRSCKDRYDGITRKGIEAIELKMLGYRTREIAERYHTTVNNVNAWISRARSKLKADPDMIRFVR